MGWFQERKPCYPMPRQQGHHYRFLVGGLTTPGLPCAQVGIPFAVKKTLARQKSCHR